MPRAASSFGGRHGRSRPRRRQRRGESSSSCSSTSLHPSKRAIVGPDLESRRATIRAWGNQPLSTTDRDVFEIMEKERQRQVCGIELIASENFVCRAVLEALGSHLTNKYSEGMPGTMVGTSILIKLSGSVVIVPLLLLALIRRAGV